MRFKLGMAVGFGAGYLMGARAGRYRYDQIVKTAKDFMNSNDGLRGIADQVQTQASEILGSRRERKIMLDADRVEERVEPYVAAARVADGGVLPHNEPL